MRQIFTTQYEWRRIASLTAAGTKPTTDKTKTAVEALGSTKMVAFEVPEDKGGFEIRAYTDASSSEDDDNIVQLYALREGDTDYMHIGQVTFTSGTQLRGGTGGERFADACTTASEHEVVQIIEGAGEDDSIGTFLVKVRGYKRFAIVMTTKDPNTTTLYIERAWVAGPGSHAE